MAGSTGSAPLGQGPAGQPVCWRRSPQIQAGLWWPTEEASLLCPSSRCLSSGLCNCWQSHQTEPRPRGPEL